MRGEFVGVWSETWNEIWENLGSSDTAPQELFGELYRELSDTLRQRPAPEAIAYITEDRGRSREALQTMTVDQLQGERGIVAFLESVFDVIEDLGGDTLANLYFNSLATFIEKYSLRYDLRRPCSLCPTLPGIFANQIRQLRAAAGLDAHLHSLMHAFEEAVRDLRLQCDETRIKTCFQRQMNLLEALGMQCPGVTQNTLGRICDQLGTWPHTKIKEAMKSLYGFASDYPGIRHAGTPSSAIRVIGMRDLVGISIALVGLTSYLTDLLDADCVYRGA